MSLILDALRKSERTRQQTLSGRVSAAGSPFDHARVPVPWASLIGLLLIANVIVLAVIFWRSHVSAPPPPVAAVSVRPEVIAPVTVYRPAVRSLAAEAAGIGQFATTAPAAGSATTVQAVASHSTVAVPAPAAQTTAAVAASVPQRPVPAADGGNLSNADNVPLLDSLPLAFQQSFPALHLDVHGYTADPANRFVVINMQRYQKGDTLAEGPTVVAIVVNGVILEYHGQKFLLPRP